MILRLILRARLSALLLGVALALTGCTSGAGRYASLSAGDAQRLGDDLHLDLMAQFGGRYDNPRLAALVSEVGARLALSGVVDGATQPRRWTFTVLDSPTENAFALPGGYVYVTRGLLAYLDGVDALAGVIAHEMGHVLQRHYEQRLEAARRGLFDAYAAGRAAEVAGASRAAQAEAAAAAWLTYVAGFSREQESQADLLAVRALARAGYDPRGQVALLETLQRIEALDAHRNGAAYSADTVDWWSMHPPNAERLRVAKIEARAAADATATGADGGAGSQQLLDAVDGALFGDSPEDGLVRDREFLHPVLRVAFTAPANFTLHNTAEAVVAIGPQNQAINFVGGDETYPGSMLELLEGVSSEAAATGDAPLRDIRALRIGRLDAAIATAPEIAALPGFEARIAAVADPNRRVFFFIAFTPRERAAEIDRPLTAMLRSFRLLSAAEAARLTPRWLRVVTAGPGDSVAALARRMNVDDPAEPLFRALNGLGPSDRLKPGQRVKIVSAR